MRTLAFWLGLLLIFLVPWEQLVNIEGLGTISRLMGVLVAGVWLLCAVANGVRKLSSFHAVVFVFVIWNALSILWTVEPTETVERIGTYFRVGLLTVILWDLYRTRESVHLALQAFVLGGLVPACSTIANYLAGVQTEYGRYSTGGDNMNTTAFVLALTIPAALFLAVESGDSNSRWRSHMRLLNFGCVLLAIFAIGLTATRFAILMTVPAWLYGIGMLIRSGRVSGLLTIGLMAAAMVAVVGMLPRESVERIASTGSEVSSGDLNGRTIVWKLGIAEWKKHPMIGIGAAASGEPSVPYYGFPKAMHNSFVSILVELGLIGIGLSGVILLMAFGHIMRMNANDAAFWLTMGAVWLLGNMPLTCFHTKETWLVLGLLIAYPVSLRKSETSTTPSPDLAIA